MWQIAAFIHIMLTRTGLAGIGTKAIKSNVIQNLNEYYAKSLENSIGYKTHSIQLNKKKSVFIKISIQDKKCEANPTNILYRTASTY